MATLPQITLDFNRQIKLLNDGGSLSSDPGEFNFREFDEKVGFSKTIAEHLHVKDIRKYHVHSNENLLRQKIYQLIAGYAEDDSADELTDDPVFTKVIGTDALASQPSLSRFYTRFDEESIQQLNQTNQELLDKMHALENHRRLFLIWIPPTPTHMGIKRNQLTIRITERLVFIR